MKKQRLEQILIKKTARDFADNELAPGAVERDEKKIWPKEKPFPSLYNTILKYIKKYLDKDLLKNLRFSQKKKVKYVLRALPNEIGGGISTSLMFSAWNAAIYVNQMSDEQVIKAERNKNYLNIVKEIVNKNKGLHFNDEMFIIERK